VPSFAQAAASVQHDPSAHEVQLPRSAKRPSHFDVDDVPDDEDPVVVPNEPNVASTQRSISVHGLEAQFAASAIVASE
jgi:hypothetical protein